MAIEKSLTPIQSFKEAAEPEISIEVENPESVSIETEDGGMIIDFTGEQVEEIMGGDFDRNLAEEIDENE